jgi:hypothetical protein
VRVAVRITCAHWSPGGSSKTYVDGAVAVIVCLRCNALLGRGSLDFKGFTVAKQEEEE